MKDEEPYLENSTFLDDAKNIFMVLKEKNGVITESDKLKKIYLEAEKIEKQSEDFYREKSEVCSNETEKKIFLRLASEERRHFILIGNLLEFILRPETWVESPEFNNRDEY